MRSLLPAIVSLLISVGLMVSMLRVASRPAPAPERPFAPLNGWPVRRHRRDTMQSLFIDTPEFKRRIVAGWESRDRNRVPR